MLSFLIFLFSDMSSYTKRVIYSATNILEMRPMVRVTAKPLMGPVPNCARTNAEIRVVRFESKMAQNALSKPRLTAILTDFPHEFPPSSVRI